MRLTQMYIDQMVDALSHKIKQSKRKYTGIFPVLKGGYYVATRLSRVLGIPLIEYVLDDCLIVDDICDSGDTLTRLRWSDADTAVLVARRKTADQVTYYGEIIEKWVDFPWETQEDDNSIITRMLQRIGEDPKREGLLDTPSRVIRMWGEIFRGYKEEEKPNVQAFRNGSDGLVYDQMITDTGKFHSHCEHHMVPFFGEYFFAYIPNPNGNIVDKEISSCSSCQGFRFEDALVVGNYKDE